MSDETCHACDRPGEDACERCRRPTCADHYFDQDHLGICESCNDEVEALAAKHGGLTMWPYPVRAVKPEWVSPDGPEVLTGRG